MDSEPISVHAADDEAAGRSLLEASDYTAYTLPPYGIPAPPAPPGNTPRTYTTLKFSNLWQDDQYEKTIFGNPKILVELFILIAATIMGIIVFVNVLSCYVLPYVSEAYRELDVFGQLAVTTNMLYVILLVLQTVPYTVVIIGILFGDARSRDFPPFYTIVFIFLTTHALLYAYEGVVRSIVKVNYFLLIHHMMFFVLMITEFVDQSNFVVKTCMILDYFVVWEAGLFLTNVCYRLHVNYTLMKWVMIAGTTIHGVTHFIQAMLLTTYFIAMGKRIKLYNINVGVYVFIVLLCTFLVGYQYYLEHIFYIMWIKVVKAQRKKEKDLEEGEEEDDDEPGGDKKDKEDEALLSAGAKDSADPNGSNPAAIVRVSTMRQGSLTRQTSLTWGSNDRARLIEEEGMMLGELPTFPASMAARHMPRTSDSGPSHKLHAEEEKAPLISSSNKKSNSSPPNSNGGAIAAVAVADPATSSSALPPLAPKPVDGVEVKKKKKKRADDGLTPEMWEMTED